MNLRLIREEFTEKTTIGSLFIDGERECWTLEDCYRPVKIPGKTSIPYGTYEIVITFSNRFQRPLPLLLNVQNFEGVRIHPGNTEADTEGCILVGQRKEPDRITQSQVAFGLLFAKIKKGMESGKVMLAIEKDQRLTPS